MRRRAPWTFQCGDHLGRVAIKLVGDVVTEEPDKISIFPGRIDEIVPADPATLLLRIKIAE